MDLVDRKKEVILWRLLASLLIRLVGVPITALGVPIIRRKERTTVPSRVAKSLDKDSTSNPATQQEQQ